MAMAYRINAGSVPADPGFRIPDWVEDRISESMPFVDLLTYLNGTLPCSVFCIRHDGTPPS